MNDKLRRKLVDFEGKLFVTKMSGARGTKKYFSTRPELLVEYHTQSSKNPDKAPKIECQCSTTTTRPYISNENISQTEEESKNSLPVDTLDATYNSLIETQSTKIDIGTSFKNPAKTLGDQYREKMNAYIKGSNWAEYFNIQPFYPLSLSSVLTIESCPTYSSAKINLTPEKEEILMKYFDSIAVSPKYAA